MSPQRDSQFRRTGRSGSEQGRLGRGLCQEEPPRRDVSQAAGGRFRQARHILEHKKKGFKEELEELSKKLLMIQQESASRQRMDRIDQYSERMAMRTWSSHLRSALRRKETPRHEGGLGHELAEFEDWARGELQRLRGEIQK